MSDQKLFVRYKASEIKADFQNVEVKKFRLSAVKKKVALKKIIANLTLGNINEMSYLFPEIVKFWQVEDDPEVRRICHEYVRKIGPTKPKNAKDALPLIINDLRSKNSRVQIMALRTLTMVPSTEFVEEAIKFISAIVNRQSTTSSNSALYIEVEREAIYSIIPLDEIAHDKLVPLFDTLQDIIESDQENPSIQIAALSTLYTIYDKKPKLGIFSLPQDVTIELLHLIPRLTEWDTATLLKCITGTVIPQSHSDVDDLFDLVKPQLQHVNTYVALNALKFIIYLLNYVDSITESLSKKLSNSIIALLNKPPELQFLVLRNVILLLLSRETSFLTLDVSYFFVEYNDPIYIKDTKLECLYLLANNGNLPQILEELEQYATDIDIQMSRKAIRAIGNLAVKLDEISANDCVNTLLTLLDFKVEYVAQEVISVFRNILRKYPVQHEHRIKDLVQYAGSIQECESKIAMIWIITNYSNILPNYLETFKIFSTNLLDENLEVQFAILTAVVKIFVKSPTKDTEALCMQILRSCTENADNPDLRNRAFVFWRLLSLSQNQQNDLLKPEDIQQIVDGQLPLIELNTKLDPAMLDELELNIGSIASIYLKPVNQIFRNYRTKTLPESPVLNSNRDSLQIISDRVESVQQHQDENSLNRRNMTGPTANPPVRRNTTMNYYDKPAETVNDLKTKMKSSSSSSILPKSSNLMRRLTLKKPFK